jgi:anaerobic ribonucleoside-triphosphate reductase
MLITIGIGDKMDSKEIMKIEQMIEENRNENANIKFSAVFTEMMRNVYIQKEEMKEILGDLYYEHEVGNFHIHDGDFFMSRPNCLIHNPVKIFEKGLDALDPKSKPAKHLSVALSHLANAINMHGAEFAGGAGIGLFNVFVAPFCKGLSEREIRQAVQHFIFQLNQLNVARNYQSAFTSVNMTFEIPNFMKNMPVKYKEGVFGDYEKELKVFTKIFIEELNKGDGEGRPFFFPNTIFYLKKENVDMELMKLVCKNMVEMSNCYILNGFKYGKNYATSMGAVSGDEKIKCCVKGGYQFIISLKDLYDKFDDVKTEYYGATEFKRIGDKEYYVWDTKKKGWTKIKVVMKTPDLSNWYLLTLENDTSLLLTNDHPLPMIRDGKEVVLRADEIKETDYALVPEFNDLKEVKVNEIKRVGRLNKYSYDIETESGYFEIYNKIYSHNCRTYLDDTLTGNVFTDILSTGNLSYITLNLPRVFLKYISGEIDNIDAEIDRLIDKAIEVLMIKRKIIWDNWNKGYYPFVSNPLYKDENGWYYNIGYTTMSLGIIGIADIKNICEAYNIEFDELAFVQRIREKIDTLNKYTYYELAERYGVDDYKAYDKEITRFSLIGSPAESTSERFKKLDNKLYVDILKKAGIYEKKYYTNSIYMDEEIPATAHEKLIYEQKFHPYLNAGIITHVFNAGIPKNNDYEGLVKYFIKLCKNTNVRYFTVSNVIVYCNECGKNYIGSKNDTECKFCGNKDIEMYSKITGYTQRLSGWNEGKVDEFKRRNEFKF